MSALAEAPEAPLVGPIQFDVNSVGLCTELADMFIPRERLPLSEWAEKNIILSREYAANPSAIKLYGWQREIFDTFTDPRVEEITVCCGVQMVKTLFIQTGLSYCIVEEPGPCMIVQPKELDAKAFSKERLGPMIRDCPALRGLIGASEKEGNTLLYKEFAGGSVSLVGSNAPGNMSRRSNRIVWFDEVDKYPASAGKEGDVLALGRERTITYIGKRKIVQTCSPTVAGQSRIHTSYQNSDRRKPYIPCWKCGYMQVLNFHLGVKFDTTLPYEDQPDSAYYLCANKECGAHWNDDQRWRSCELTEWRADKPFRGHAGFWINHLYSPHKTLSLMVKDFLNAKDDRNQLKAFVNTNLAEVWQEAGSSPDADKLYSQREDYPHSGEAVIPMGVMFLTAAVDVQDNRLEVEVAGWGYKRERWSVGYFVIAEQSADGELLPSTSKRLWDRLDNEILSALWQHASGKQMPIMCMCIDTGYKPKPVYDFCAKRTRVSVSPAGIKLTGLRTVVPVKGDDDPLKIISKISKEDAARKRQNVHIISVGTHCAKQEIFDVLNSVRPRADGKPVPQCYHFPMYDMEYFNGLSAEIRVVHDDGKVEYVKKPNARNEPVDCFDEETEVLTQKRGWQLFSDLTDSDKLATVNLRSNRMVFQKPTAYVKRRVSGSMVQIKGNRLDVLVTPNHRMVTYKKESRYFGRGNNRQRRWVFDVPAKITLAKDLTIHHQLKTSANWNGLAHTHLEIPASISKLGKVIDPARVVDIGDLAELLGWFLTDGSSFKGEAWTQPKSVRSLIIIYQNQGAKAEGINKLIERLPWKWQVYKRAGKVLAFSCASSQLYKFLSDGGRNVYSKRIPQWLKDSSFDVIKRFLDAAVAGDGWTQAGKYRIIATVSKDLADGYQELFLKIGVSSSIIVRPAASDKHQPQFWVREIANNGSAKASLDGGGNGKREYLGKTVQYSGMVYCATVPNGTLFVRRNGKVIVAGNCAVYNRAAAAIVGIDRFSEEHWQQMREQLGLPALTEEDDDEYGEDDVDLIDSDTELAGNDTDSHASGTNLKGVSGALKPPVTHPPAPVPPAAPAAAPASRRSTRWRFGSDS